MPSGDTNFVANSAQSPTNSFGGVGASTSPPRSDRDLTARADVSAWADDEEARLRSIRSRSREDPRKQTTEASLDGPAFTSRIDGTGPPAGRRTGRRRNQAESGENREEEEKKKKRSSFFDPKETLKLVAGVSVVVGLVAFFAWGYPELRFPLGGLLCVYRLHRLPARAVSIRQVVAEEGVLKVLVFRFCPPYQWWFVATHWEETQDFVAFCRRTCHHGDR